MKTILPALHVAVGIVLTGITQSSGQSLSTVQFTAASYSVSEAGAVALIIIERIGETGGTAYVEYNTSNGTATEADYVGQSGFLQFFGETNTTIEVPIANDAFAEGTETIFISLSNPDPFNTQLGSRTEAVIVILDNDSGVEFSPCVYSVGEDIGLVTIAIQRMDDFLAPMTVDLIIGGGTAVPDIDFFDPTAWLSFAIGETNKTVVLEILNDNTSEEDETLILVLRSNQVGTGSIGRQKHVVVSIRDDDGVPQTRSALECWHERYPFPTTADLQSVVHGNGRFVAVGSGGAIATSDDGVCWFPAHSGTSAWLGEVAYGSGRFVAVGVEWVGDVRSILLSSTDGANWIPFWCEESCYLTRVTYGNGVFVAVGRNGVILTSTNGLGWEGVSSGTVESLDDIAYGKGTFIAVGGNEILASPKRYCMEPLRICRRRPGDPHKSTLWQRQIWRCHELLLLQSTELF